MLIIIVDDEKELHESMKHIIVKRYPEVTFEDYYSPRVFLDRLLFPETEATVTVKM